MKRVFSLWQPWATLCVAIDPVTGHPPKQYETRAWPPKYELPFDVVIHATKKWSRELADLCTEPVFRRALARCGYSFAPDRQGFREVGAKPLPLGLLIGVARVVGVDRTEKLSDGQSRDELWFGDWSVGRHAWRLENAVELPEPIPFVGRQEPLYRLDDYYEELIAKQLGQFA